MFSTQTAARSAALAPSRASARATVRIPTCSAVKPLRAAAPGVDNRGVGRALDFSRIRETNFYAQTGAVLLPAVTAVPAVPRLGQFVSHLSSAAASNRVNKAEAVRFTHIESESDFSLYFLLFAGLRGGRDGLRGHQEGLQGGREGPQEDQEPGERGRHAEEQGRHARERGRHARGQEGVRLCRVGSRLAGEQGRRRQACVFI